MSDKVFIIYVSNPLDVEASPEIFEIYLDGNKAKERVAELQTASIIEAKKWWKERWASYALNYDLEDWSLSDAERE